jgi:CDP-glycerol glycerophosphotransferase
MVRAGGPYRAVWSYTGNGSAWPQDAVLVRRESWRYYYELARAEYWVDNQGFPRQFTKRLGTTYVQTWHGTPLKTMGFDEPALAALPPEKQREHAAMIERWDHLVVPSEYFVQTFVAAYRYRGNLLRVGYPRNDPLLTKNDPDNIRGLKEFLDLPKNRKLVLYAPTFRDEQHRIKAQFSLKLDLYLLARELGEDYFFLIRAHYLDRVTIAPQHRSIAANVSGHPDVTELMLVADVLITDYSSLFFDYANLARPMIFYTYDYDHYLRTRGTYFDLASTVPGPLVSSTEEIVSCLRDLDSLAGKYADASAAFRAKFCGYDTGTASDQIVAQFFPGPSP